MLRVINRIGATAAVKRLKSGIISLISPSNSKAIYCLARLANKVFARKQTNAWRECFELSQPPIVLLNE